MNDDTLVSGRPAWRPSHPGALLREDILPALGIGVSEAADYLHVSRQMLHRILAEESAVSPEMAVRLGKLCGDGPRIWLAMQQAHDLWQAERDLADEVGHIPTLAAH
jgi:addiction module HigA family antidote